MAFAVLLRANAAAPAPDERGYSSPVYPSLRPDRLKRSDPTPCRTNPYFHPKANFSEVGGNATAQAGLAADQAADLRTYLLWQTGLAAACAVLAIETHPRSNAHVPRVTAATRGRSHASQAVRVSLRGCASRQVWREG